ncbi:MAG TPA: septation ring formation regulator EzrA [Bacilli bacterium]|nr:septation ring formation regulator EzrA [Bacilli bacterium]
MILAQTIDIISIAMWIVFGLLLLGVLIFLLSKFAFAGRKNKKLLNSLSIKYSYVQGLLLGEDLNYIRRIEAISDINLLMRPYYEDFYVRYLKLRDEDDKKAGRAIQLLNEALVAGNKEFKLVLGEQRAIILDYERKVMALNKDLVNMIKPEAEIREDSVADKEKLRNIKYSYTEQAKDLELLAPSFEKIFTQLDVLFKDYDDALNGAYYDEARTYLERIRAFNHELEKALDVLPLLVIKTTVLIPEKIVKLQEVYEEALTQNIPLHHLRVNQEIEKFQEKLAEIKTQLIRFETRGVEKALNAMSAKITNLETNFALESAKQREFTEQYDATYMRVNELEQQYIRLVNRMPQIKEFYIINPKYEQKLEQAKNLVNSMMTVKRTLDSFLHSATKQPYTVLVEKVMQLEQESVKVNEVLKEFQQHIESLRFIVEDGHAICRILFTRFKELEIMLRELDVDSYTQMFDEDFTSGYMMISEINVLVRQRPIEVTQVELLTNELRKLASRLEDTIIEDIKFAELAEEAIVSLNSYRAQFSELHNRLIDEEQRFLKGQFKTTYENTMEQLTKYRNRK